MPELVVAGETSFRSWRKDRNSRIVIAIGLFLLTYGAWQIFGWDGPDHKQAVGDIAVWPVNLAAALLAWRIARRDDLPRRVRRAWWCIGWGLVAYLLGSVLQFIYENLLHTKPYPFFADVCYIAFYPLVLVGILRFPRPSWHRSDLIRTALDASALVLGAVAVVWYLLLAPATFATGQNSLQLAFSIAYPIGDLVLIFGVTTLIVRKSHAFQGLPLYLFSSSLLVFVAADLIYGRLPLEVAHAGGDPADTLWVVAIALMAVSAHEYWRASSVSSEPVGTNFDPEDFVFLSYVAITVAFALMVATLGHESGIADGAIVVACAATAVVLARLHWSSVEKQHQKQYFRAIVERVADYVVVLGSDLVPSYASPPLLRLAGLPANAPTDDQILPRVIDKDDLPMLMAAAERAMKEADSEVSVGLRVHDAYGAVRQVVGVMTNLLEDRAVEGLVLVLHDVTENLRLEGELRDQALHDALTGLPNRALIHDRLTQLLATEQRRNSAVAALYIDLDNFKDVNDRLGHIVGDELLQAVAQRFDSVVRGQDTVGRVGGDEFVLLAAAPARTATATLIAQRIFDVMAEPFELNGAPTRGLTVGTSIGIAISDSSDPDELLRNADLALYRAKTMGKNRFVVFEPHMYSLAEERVALQNDLSEALAKHEFFLVYQPVMNLETLEPYGVEALLRWRHWGRSEIGPIDFIPILEERGLIVDVGRWVLEEACAQGARWQHEGVTLIVNVNASALQLADDRFVGHVQDALHVSGFDPSHLAIEITESVLMRERERTVSVLEKLKSLGVRIVIDDFGTGYSSLSYLRQFPIDVLKIDQSFVGDMESSTEAATLVRTIAHLSTELGIETIAEGIETPGQLSALRAENCDLGQGYWFAKPMSAEAINSFLQTWQHARAVH